jgi:hypothetical protein
VAEVLGPSLVFLGRFAGVAAQKIGLPKAVRVEVRQTGSREGALENRSDRAEGICVGLEINGYLPAEF